MALKSLSTRRSGRRVSITISLSHNEEQHMNKQTKKLHDRPSKTLNSIVSKSDILRPAEKPMIAVNYKGEEKTFTAEEVSSMIAVN
ncbi:hypothetical protein Tco_0683983 [Tanacetum coccineum]